MLEHVHISLILVILSSFCIFLVLSMMVTGLAVSDRHPYMFSAGLDKMVKCWDMEYNKVGCMAHCLNIRPFVEQSFTRKAIRACSHLVTTKCSRAGIWRLRYAGRCTVSASSFAEHFCFEELDYMHAVIFI